MAVRERLYTAEELLALPDDGKLYELVEGQLIEMSPSSEPHGRLTAEFAYLLTTHVRAHKLGQVYGAETGFKLGKSPDTVLGADAAFVAKARLKRVRRRYFEGAPDLAVEIVSPDNTRAEMHDKVKRYFQAGARLVWVAYPRARAIYVYTAPTEVKILEADDTLTGGDVLPGFSVKVADIFAVLDE